MRRTTWLAAGLAWATAAAPLSAQRVVARHAATESDSVRVVFVCEHGNVKSTVAAALFNELSAKRGLPFHAVSRGTAPDSSYPALIRDSLRAHGVDLRRDQPVGVSSRDARDAALFVTFDVDLPAATTGAIPVRRWDGTPSVMRGFAVGRDTIVARVSALLDHLERERASVRRR